MVAICVEHPVVNFTKRYCNIVFRDRYILQLLNIEIGLLYFQLSYLQHGTFSVGYGIYIFILPLLHFSIENPDVFKIDLKFIFRGYLDECVKDETTCVLIMAS